MTNNIAIDQTDETISAYLPEWKRHRLLIGGSALVRANASLFLPRVTGMEDDDFNAYARRVMFFPAAKRINDGILGLIFRKPSTIVTPAGAEDILKTITRTGFNIDVLAKRIAAELVGLNYGAILVDHPTADGALSEAAAIAKGFRPYVSFYPAESILGVPETMAVNNRQRVVRVRLLDDADTVRELRVVDGIYSVTMHRRVGGSWTADAPIIPLRNGKPMDEMPFRLVTTNDDMRPGNSHLGPVCELNVDHYLAYADYVTARFNGTVRVFVIKGAEEGRAFPIYPGAQWVSKDTDFEADILGASDSAMSEHLEAVHDVEDKLSTMGSRILEKPKEGVESAETIALRRAADNAATQALARTVNEIINDALAWVAWWLGYDEGAFTYDVNVNLDAVPLTEGERAQIQAEVASGFISKKTAIDIYKQRGNLPESFDMELDQDFIDQEFADRPPTDPAPRSEF